MPHDKNGVELKVGDRVTMEFRIEQIHPSDSHCNLTLLSVDPIYPTNCPTGATGNARQVVFVSRPDPATTARPAANLPPVIPPPPLKAPATTAATAVAVLMMVLFLALGASAQPTMPTAPQPQSLPQTILSYFTSFNPALDTTFADNRFDLAIGASSIQGAAVPLVNDVGLSYDIWRPTMANTNSGATRIAISIEDVLRNSGVAGTLVSDNLGFGVSFLVHDVRLTIYADGGVYLPTATAKRDFYAEIGLRAKKAIGPHFYTGVGLGAQVPRNSQVFSAFLGATF